MTPAKVVVLEGCDGSGKTVLARRLAAEHGYEIVKTGPPAPGEDPGLSYITALRGALARPGRTVFDRLHLGELIYGPLLRGGSRLDGGGLRVIEGVIALNDVRLVICAPPWETAVAGWRSKDDLLKTETQLRWVYDRYLEEAARLGLTPYDWTKDGAVCCEE